MDKWKNAPQSNSSHSKPFQAQTWEALAGYYFVATAERLGETGYIQQGLFEWRMRGILTSGIL
jgi:hypothetical protein